VLIGQKLREIREAKKLSQGDIERRTGLFRSYTSRVENGHNVPTVETLEKYARALEIPLYRLFYNGKSPIKKPRFATASDGAVSRGAHRKGSRELRLFVGALARMSARNRRLLSILARRLANRSAKAAAKVKRA
jgi:transcriptional regulator with XRE-family HTH domain